MDNLKSYYAIIPADVRYDKNIPDKAKLLYGEITALSNERGYCWAHNAYFADLYGVHQNTISRLVSSLKKAGYIKVEMVYVDGIKSIEERRITINPLTTKQNCVGGVNKNVDTPINKNVEDNNTLFNTTMNNINGDDFSGDSPAPDSNEKNLPFVPLAKLLYDEHKKHDDKYLAGVNLQHTFLRWAKDIRLLVERDKRDIETIREVIIWCQAPGCFWIPNILSGKTLREKFPMLYSQCKRDNDKKIKKEQYEKNWDSKYAGKLKKLES